MAYETPITIKKTINNIKKGHYVLPSIQREFVWDTDQIEMLFDSLMRDYPISTFLFWRVDKDKIEDFKFYYFLKNYHEKKGRHNIKADLSNDEDVIAILDGQQRMTSMYLGLTGSYAKKKPYFRKNSNHAYPEKKLYLNLFSPSEEMEVEYDFKFLTEKEATNTEENLDKGIYWFRCGLVLDFSEITDGMEYLTEKGLLDKSVHGAERTQFAMKTLNRLYKCVNEKGTISYYLEEGETLDKVLQIFIRINSGGTKLSYSDLLLSIATAQWKDKDAREVIHAYVDEINAIGDGFNFNKDIVLKSCLVMADFKDIKFKVDNFTQGNMAQIEKNWDKISHAFSTAIELVSSFGYSKENLLANNAIIPIAYFIYKNNFESSILNSSKREKDRKVIKEWLARVLLKGTFGGQPDSIYPKMRDLINANMGRFPLAEIIEYYKGNRKTINFTEDDIESILDLQYGAAKTYCALTLLYPGLDHKTKYHQDHIHPKSFFKPSKLRKLGIEGENYDYYIDWFNCLPNLQLLEATRNTEKSNKEFSQWLDNQFSTKSDKESFLQRNHIAVDQSLLFEDFYDFNEQRWETLKNKLIKILNVKVEEVETEDMDAFE